MDMAQVKCHGAVSLWRFLLLPNSPVADRKGIRATKNLLSLKVLILWYSVSHGIGAGWVLIFLAGPAANLCQSVCCLAFAALESGSPTLT